MKLLDANLLIYAVDEDSARFARAHPWVEGVLGGRETVALPGPSYWRFSDSPPSRRS